MVVVVILIVLNPFTTCIRFPGEEEPAASKFPRAKRVIVGVIFRLPVPVAAVALVDESGVTLSVMSVCVGTVEVAGV